VSESTSPAPNPVRVWDVPTRLVHWLLVLMVAFAWWTAETGRMAWHQYAGYTLFALVCFRIYWGFFGSRTARFSQFVRGPRTVATYLAGRWPAVPGHNPLGALSVIALLALLATQIVLGLFAVDVDGIESGPLSTYVSFEAGRVAARWHDRLFDALTWLVGLHVAAVLFYVLVKKENLLGAMVHGKRVFSRAHEPLQPVSRVRFVVGVVLAAALTWMVARAFQLA
jgi:cytochrome b